MAELLREAAELRASRTRIVTAADDERRSIERVLHEGAMQHLSALSVSLQLARALDDTDARTLAALLEEMLRTVHEALDDLRQLAWRVYPSPLLDGGLVDALQIAASQTSTPTSLELAGVRRYPREVEAAIYFCCVDLMQWAADDDHRIGVRVRSEPATVLFDVTVEGADFDVWARRDLNILSDRLGAFGGQLTIAPALEAGRGVRISGAVPIEPGDHASRAEASSTSAR
jgi:signal transduction histidine kinase